MQKIKAVFYIVWGIVLSAPVLAQETENRFDNDKVSLRLFSNFEQVNPLQNLEIFLRFKMHDGWHIFSQEPGEAGMPTQVKWSLPQGYCQLEESWSRDETFETEGIVQHGYGDTAYYKATIRPDAASAAVGGEAVLTADVRWLACREECVPEKARLRLKLPITYRDLLPGKEWQNVAAAAQEWFHPRAEKEEFGLWLVLLMAFAGGIVLNFMPCIFPILAIKAISLSQTSYSKYKSRMESLFYTLGVIVSFLIMAAILYALRSQGEYLGWGFQLQSPVFVGIMIVVFAVIALMFLDIVVINNPFADKLGRMSFQNHLLSSFMTGFLAVLIASPCTAPFMGVAVGYTLSAPPHIYYPVFFVLGLGYALPFALAGLFPKIIAKILPRPGKWMVILKKIFAIPVLLTCVWLVWVLYNQLIPRKAPDLLWKEYDVRGVEQLLSRHEPVFVDFTAKWCITCLINRETALQSKEFEKLVDEHGIHLFRADWTNNSENIARALASYGRNSIPLYVYYDGKSDDYLILPQLLTPGILREYLK